MKRLFGWVKRLPPVVVVAVRSVVAGVLRALAGRVDPAANAGTAAGASAALDRADFEATLVPSERAGQLAPEAPAVAFPAPLEPESGVGGPEAAPPDVRAVSRDLDAEIAATELRERFVSPSPRRTGIRPAPVKRRDA